MVGTGVNPRQGPGSLAGTEVVAFVHKGYHETRLVELIGAVLAAR